MPYPDQWFFLLGNPGHGVYNNIMSTPALTTTGKLLPTVVKCDSEDEALRVHGICKDAFSKLDDEIKRTEASFDDLLRFVEADSTLQGVSGRIYPVYRPRQGIGLITFSHTLDIAPMFVKGNPDKYECRFQRVDTLAQALVFLLARADREKLRDIGFNWVKYDAEEDNKPTVTPTRKPAQSPPSSPQKSTTNGGRNMQSQSKTATQDTLAESLTKLSLGQHESLLSSLSSVSGGPPSGPAPARVAKSTAPFRTATQAFRLRVVDIQEVKAAAEALGLSAAAAVSPGIADGFLIVGTDAIVTELLGDLIKGNMTAPGLAKEFVSVSTREAMIAIQAWASLAS